MISRLKRVLRRIVVRIIKYDEKVTKILNNPAEFVPTNVIKQTEPLRGIRLLQELDKVNFDRFIRVYGTKNSSIWYRLLKKMLDLVLWPVKEKV